MDLGRGYNETPDMSVLTYRMVIGVTLFKIIKRVSDVAQRDAGLRRSIDYAPRRRGRCYADFQGPWEARRGFTVGVPDKLIGI